MATTYWDYRNLDTLLGLQGGLENDESQQLPDELHFIIVHQAYELWGLEHRVATLVGDI